MKIPDIMEVRKEFKVVNNYLALSEQLLNCFLEETEKEYVDNAKKMLTKRKELLEKIEPIQLDKYFLDVEVISKERRPFTLERLLKEDVSALQWRVRIAKLLSYTANFFSYFPMPKKYKESFEKEAEWFKDEAEFCQDKIDLIIKTKDLEKEEKQREQELRKTYGQVLNEKGIKMSEEFLEKIVKDPLLVAYFNLEFFKQKYLPNLDGEYDYLNNEEE